VRALSLPPKVESDSSSRPASKFRSTLTRGRRSVPRSPEPSR
jgi:hypothetical protein